MDNTAEHKRSIDLILRNSSNPYLKELYGNSRRQLTMEELGRILEYEYSRHLAAVFKKELELLHREAVILELESEHGNSLALIIRIESQKYELEELKKNLEAMTVKLERLSVMDGLTNLANRRHFDNFLELAWRSATRDSLPLALLMIDVDHFKPYNDNYGHQKGDECLKQVAAALDGFSNRSKDLVARFGGEEFAIILADTTKSYLLHIAENIRKAVEDLNITHEYSDAADRITISVGASLCRPSKSSCHAALIKAADYGLYQAKKMGRNMVQFHELTPENI